MGVRQVRAVEVAELLKAGKVRLIDVRTPGEHATASVPGAELLNPSRIGELEALPKHTPLAFLCHHGMRSQRAAMHFEALGFTDLVNVIGGIDAWSNEVDPSIPTY